MKFVYFYSGMYKQAGHIDRKQSNAFAAQWNNTDLSEERQHLRKELIDKIGPWAFQSVPRGKWHAVSDQKIIEGALLRAKPEHKLMLLDLYNLNLIKEVWERYVVIQDRFFHGANVWAAEHLFNQEQPEDFVRRKYRRASRLNKSGKLL